MNKFVKVSYNLYTISEDGKQELIERASAEHPFQFITGMDIALDAFEQKISELETGEEFNFVLPVEQAYGPYLQERIIELGKELFSVDGHFDARNIYPGNVVPLMNEDGNRFQGIVKEVGETTVKLDLNHPLAGNTLQFKGRVIESREATKEEVQGMINLMSGEGCGCDDCGGHRHHHEGGDGCCGKHGHHEGGCCGNHEHRKEGEGGCGNHGHHEGGCCGKHEHRKEGEGGCGNHGHHEGGCCGKRHNG